MRKTEPRPTTGTVRLYSRISADAQADNFSIPSQHERGHAWATYQGLGGVVEYDDLAQSGDKDSRPALALSPLY